MVDVTTENSLNHSMNSALKHYSSLFFLPPFKKALVAMAVLCIGVVGLSTLVLFPSVSGLINGLFLGISLFAANIVFDYVVSKLVLRQDPIFVLRRTVALSLFCWILWLFFIILGVVFGAVFKFMVVDQTLSSWLFSRVDSSRRCVPFNIIELGSCGV